MVLGTSAPRVDGVRKVTGQATYGADVNMPGMLWCKLARSTMPHARLLRVDATKARQMPGVQAVITAAGHPRSPVGPALEDMPVLARGKVRFIGEPIAAVAADDPDMAEEAALAVEVEYEELPAIFDAREAMKAGAARIHDDLMTYKGLPKPVPETPNTCPDPSLEQGRRRSRLPRGGGGDRARVLHPAAAPGPPRAARLHRPYSTSRAGCRSRTPTRPPSAAPSRWRRCWTCRTMASTTTPRPWAATSAARARR